MEHVRRGDGAGGRPGLLAVLLALLAGCGQATPTPSGEAVTATVETTPVPDDEDAADDPAIWVHPSDPSLSTVIGTNKQRGLHVYDLDGEELHSYEDGEINNVDVRYGFPLGGERVDLVVASNYDDSNSLRVYRVDPQTRGLVHVSARVIGVDADVYGLCLHRSAEDGAYYAFATTRDGRVQQWRLFDDGSGRVDATLERELDVGSLAEGCVADDEKGALYVAEEDVGIWRYGAEPGDRATRTRVDSTGPAGHLTADVEGLALYRAADGGGYLLASSQGSDDFAVHRRDGGNEYLTRFPIEEGAVDAVSSTDGIDVVSLPLGDAFPEGLLVAADDVNPDGNQNFKLVPWGRVARGVSPPLVVDTSVDPRAR